MPSANQSRWPDSSNSAALGDVGRVDEVVARLHVALPRVVLHQPADGAALGVEDGQARADLLGEAEEVELGAELAVVAPLGLLQLVQVGGQRLLGLPGRPVDPLQLLALLVAPPVRAGHPHELEVAQPAGRGHVRPAAQVDEGVGVPVGADTTDRRRRRPRRRPVPTASMISCLKGWSAKISSPSSSVCSWRTKGWSSLMIARISASIRSRSSSLKWAPSGQLEVVVEAVLDHRPDGVLGARPQAADGLGHHVGGRVAQHLAAGVGVGGDDGDLRRRRAAAVSRSTSRPSTVATTAALARREPMDWASSAAVVPSASSRVEPSGRPTEMTPGIVHPFLLSRTRDRSWSGHRSWSPKGTGPILAAGP